MDVGGIGGLSTPVVVDCGALATMLDAARAAGSIEACGLLFGNPGTVREATVARNVAGQPWRRFEIDPAHLFDAHRRARSGPVQLLGCWHSHPGGSALPSAADRAGVRDMDWLWCIVASGRVRGFRPAARGFDEVALLAPAL